MCHGQEVRQDRRQAKQGQSEMDRGLLSYASICLFGMAGPAEQADRHLPLHPGRQGRGRCLADQGETTHRGRRVGAGAHRQAQGQGHRPDIRRVCREMAGDAGGRRTARQHHLRHQMHGQTAHRRVRRHADRQDHLGRHRALCGHTAEGPPIRRPRAAVQAPSDPRRRRDPGPGRHRRHRQITIRHAGAQARAQGGDTRRHATASPAEACASARSARSNAATSTSTTVSSTSAAPDSPAPASSPGRRRPPEANAPNQSPKPSSPKSARTSPNMWPPTRARGYSPAR